MQQYELTELISQNLISIRHEYHLSQDKMAQLLGLSKKTLVEIEKGRKQLSWTASVALIGLCHDSIRIHDLVGGDAMALTLSIAYRDLKMSYPKTMGGKVWWKSLQEQQGFVVQQNLFTHHYRILDSLNHRRFASFHLHQVLDVLSQLSTKGD
jgi:DNA-binding XRE family transcriptional regulator